MAISYLMFCLLSSALANTDIGALHRKVNISAMWSAISPLKLAAMEGRIEDAEAILHKNLTIVDERDSLGMTPLHWGALGGHSDVVLFLLNSGADPNATDEDGNTALHLSSDPKTTRWLILGGSYVNAQNVENATALHLAVKNGGYATVKTLLSFGAATDITDVNGRTPLDVAVLGNNMVTIKLLQSCGAKNVKYTLNGNLAMTTTEMTPTTPSLSKRKPKATRTPEVRTLSDSEQTLFKAAREGFADKIADLCAKGVDPNIADFAGNATPLHIASAAGKTLAALTLIRCGANMNFVDENGNTPLHLAVINEFYKTSDLLLLSGADYKIKNRVDNNAYELSLTAKHMNFKNSFNTDVLDWFVDVRSLSADEKQLHTITKEGKYIGVAKKCKSGVDVRVKNKDNNEMTALHLAVTARWHVENMIQTLVRCGADVNAKDADGNTPLHIAITESVDAAFTTLLLNRADLFIPNNKGRTPYQVGSESGSPFVKRRLASPLLDWFQDGMMIL